MSKLVYKEDTETFHVKSRSDPDKQYMVYRSKKNGWVCGCKGYMFGGTCWHIEYVIKEYGLER